ncbi:MAG: DUF4394 domain-containing protein, partial [Ilumatobacteraceae bacterium]
ACGGVGNVADQPVAAAVTANAELSTLAEALATTGLDGVLGDDGPFTVFAPVDSAFEAVADLDALLAEPDQLTALLALHVVDEQRLGASDLATGGTVPSLGGELSFTQDADALVVNGAATVVCADIQTANATVHLIDTVLTPPVEEEVVTGSQLFSVDLATGAATPLGAIGEELGVLGLAYAPDDSGQVYGLTDAAELITFFPAEPASVTSVPITGVAAGSTLVAIDAPADDPAVYAVSDASILYRIDPATGAATSVGDGINPPLTDPGIGFEVDPETSGARIAVSTGENLRLDLTTGSVALDPASEQPVVDGPFSEPGTDAGLRLVALAETITPADGRELYAIDAVAGTLVLVESPREGLVRTIGPLGISVTDGASFDIDAYAAQPLRTALLVVPG